MDISEQSGDNDDDKPLPSLPEVSSASTCVQHVAAKTFKNENATNTGLSSKSTDDIHDRLQSNGAESCSETEACTSKTGLSRGTGLKRSLGEARMASDATHCEQASSDEPVTKYGRTDATHILQYLGEVGKHFPECLTKVIGVAGGVVNQSNVFGEVHGNVTIDGSSSKLQSIIGMCPFKTSVSM